VDPDFFTGRSEGQKAEHGAPQRFHAALHRSEQNSSTSATLMANRFSAKIPSALLIVL
jgi:hypothetical protein